MNVTQTALLAGLILGAAGALGGFTAFIITLVIGAVGLVIGLVLDGRVDAGGLLGRGRDR